MQGIDEVQTMRGVAGWCGRVVAGAVIVVAVSACGGNDSSASSTTASVPTTGTSASSTSMAGEGVCQASALVPEVTNTDAGAGQRYLTIGLKNMSSATCTLSGFVDVAVYNGSTVVVAKSHHADVSTMIANIVAPGRSLYFDAHYAVVETGNESCPPADRLEITPPTTINGNVSLPLTHGEVPRICPASGVEVSPLRTSPKR